MKTFLPTARACGGQVTEDATLIGTLREEVWLRGRLGNDRFWTVGVRMGVERPVNYLLKEKAGSTMLELKTSLDSSRLGAVLFAGRINS